MDVRRKSDVKCIEHWLQALKNVLVAWITQKFKDETEVKFKPLEDDSCIGYCYDLRNGSRFTLVKGNEDEDPVMIWVQDYNESASLTDCFLNELCDITLQLHILSGFYAREIERRKEWLAQYISHRFRHGGKRTVNYDGWEHERLNGVQTTTGDTAFHLIEKDGQVALAYTYEPAFNWWTDKDVEYTPLAGLYVEELIYIAENI